MYEPIGWKANDNGVGYVMKKYVGQQAESCKIRRYFGRYQDLPSRADLAYEMLRVASLSKLAGVYFQHFYDPTFGTLWRTRKGSLRTLQDFSTL